MKILNKSKKKMHSPPSDDRKGLRRSLRLRLKASNTSLDVRSSRKLFHEKRGSFRMHKSSIKISKRKLSTKLAKAVQDMLPKRSRIHSRGKDRNQSRVSKKDKVRKEVKSDNLPERNISILPTRTRNPKVSKLADGKSTKRKKTNRGFKVSNRKSKKSQALEKVSKMIFKSLNSFSTERHDYTRQDIIRFWDVAFLDDNHILALDDHFLKEKFGHRICCFTLDGTLLCELHLPAHPWSVVVINPTEAVVSLRDTPSHGLIWLSVDVSSRSMEIVRNIPLDKDCYGLAYNGDVFTVSHYGKKFISILNTKSEEIGRISVKNGSHYRSIFLRDQTTLVYLDYQGNTIRCINLDGREVFSLEYGHCSSPIALSQDKLGNIYVGNWVSGNIAQFSETGEFVGNVLNVNKVSGLAINPCSDLMAVAHDHFISLYRLLYEEDTL